MQSGNKRCPNCQQEGGFGKLGRKLKNVIDKQKVKCRCEEQMNYLELMTTHKDKCLSKEMMCPLECGQNLTNR